MAHPGTEIDDNRQDVERGSQVLHLDRAESKALDDAMQAWRSQSDARQHGFFLARKHRNYLHLRGEAGSNTEKQKSQARSEDTNENTSWAIGSLRSYETGFFDGSTAIDQYVGFVDPSTYPNYPGWMLRNLLVLVRCRWKLQRLQVLCYRVAQGREIDAKSIILPIEIASQDSDQMQKVESEEMPKVTGWERNGAGKIVSKMVNVGEYLDPRRYIQVLIQLISCSLTLEEAWLIKLLTSI